MRPRHKRVLVVLGGVSGLGVAAGLALSALDSNVAFFFTPSQVEAGKAPHERAFRVGGLVKPGSLQREQMNVRFVITDTARDMTVRYTGILPDLFKEGKGAVAQGRLGAHGEFIAAEVLAKHDENYMPPEAQHAIDVARRRAGTAQGQP